MHQLVERSVGGLLAIFCAFIIVVTAGGGIRSWTLIQPEPVLRVGAEAPSVTLALAEEPGFVLDTARLRGRPFMITRWTERCGNCADSLRLANQYQADFGPNGFMVLAVNEGSYLEVFRSRGVLSDLAPLVVQLEDVLGTVRLRIRTEPEPRWVLIGASGKVVGFGSSIGPSRDMVAAASSL
jgi:hypothetical protein